jgi:osmotically-inducible protein OsmY
MNSGSQHNDMFKTSHRWFRWFGWMVGCWFVVPGDVSGASHADRRIESMFVESAVYRMHLKGNQVQAVAAGGVVTLTGRVSSLSGKALAQEVLLALPGVQRVNNQLTVVLEGGEHGDAWVRSKVGSVLALHRLEAGRDIDVGFRAGVLTLSGTVANEGQIAMASAYAADVYGVERVVQEMRVVPEPASSEALPLGGVDDPSITAQVRVLLKLHCSTAALDPQVRTLEGVVTVEGVAPTSREIERVSQVASDVRGVKSLLNRMTLAPLPGITVLPRPVSGLRVVSGGD